MADVAVLKIAFAHHFMLSVFMQSFPLNASAIVVYVSGLLSC